MKRKFHVRFCTGGGAGDRPTDRSGADPLIESCFAAGLVCVSRLWLLGMLFHPWAAQLRPLGSNQLTGVNQHNQGRQVLQ